MSASLSVGLSFSVATMAKSAKMVPVMRLGFVLPETPAVELLLSPEQLRIGSLLLGSKTFGSAQIAQAAAIVSGTGLISTDS